MSTSLSKLVDNLSGNYIKKYRDRNCESECGFKGPKNDKLSYNCQDCKKKKLKPINRLIAKFPNTCTFCNNDINKFILWLRKWFYPYEYIDIWERFNETTLPNKRALYSKLYLEHITDDDYRDAQKLF